MMKTLLVPAGRFAHPQGVQVLDAPTLERIFKAAKRVGRDIPVDFDHAAFFAADAPLAGRVALNSLALRPEGIFGTIDLTPAAAAMVRAGTYRYLSPALAYNPQHTNGNELHVERIVSMGLTNQPNMPAMRPLSHHTNKEEIMQELLTQLKAALGLPPETEDAQTLAKALEKLQPADKEASAEAETATEDVADAGNEPAQSGAPGMEEFQALKRELADMKQKLMADQVNGAIAAGKILPAQRDWAVSYAANDPEGFRQFITNSKAVVNMGKVVSSAGSAARKKPLDPAQERMNALLGISRETFDKYNPEQ